MCVSSTNQLISLLFKKNYPYEVNSGKLKRPFQTRSPNRPQLKNYSKNTYGSLRYCVFIFFVILLYFFYLFCFKQHTTFKWKHFQQIIKKREKEKCVEITLIKFDMFFEIRWNHFNILPFDCLIVQKNTKLKPYRKYI